MMKIVSAAVMREAERRTMEEFSLPGLTLMETAGIACADVILGRYGGGDRIASIFCGKGNNGGDGYVIARCLKQKGWKVHVVVLAEKAEITGDAAVNLARLDPSDVVFCSSAERLATQRVKAEPAAVLVDAVFGIGLRSEPAGVYASAIELINSCSGAVVAVDIPSGVDATSGKTLGNGVRADLTVTFGFAKHGHVCYPGAEYCGELIVADIGLPPQVVAGVEADEFLDPKAAARLLRRRARTSHKGDNGHCLVIAGSPGKTGAAALAANSAVRAGSGLVTLAVPERLNPVLEVKTTEAMTLPLSDGGSGYLGPECLNQLHSALTGKDVVAVGPGISRTPETVAVVRQIVAQSELPMVVDADGLNALSEDIAILLERKSAPLVLTPHPGEMSRLTGLPVTVIENDRIGAAREFARKYGIHLVLKGARTIVCSPDGKIAVNGSGNPGMASGGMGDVLTGLIASLVGQRYPLWDACRLGVFVHGLAADLVAKEKGEIGISAVDVQERIPWAYRELMQTGEFLCLPPLK
jgi:NAD(P)H-hydrate epimerase